MGSSGPLEPGKQGGGGGAGVQRGDHITILSDMLILFQSRGGGQNMPPPPDFPTFPWVHVGPSSVALHSNLTLVVEFQS